MSEATTAQHNLATSLMGCMTEAPANESERKSLVEELSALEEMKERLVVPSEMWTVGQEILHALLDHVTAEYDLTVGANANIASSSVPLVGGPDAAGQDDDTADPDELSEQEVYDIIDAIIKKNEFKPDFVNGKKHNEFTSEVMQFRRSEMKTSEEIKVLQDSGDLGGSKFVSLETLAEYDRECAEVRSCP